jgi:hypothetical protein
LIKPFQLVSEVVVVQIRRTLCIGYVAVVVVGLSLACTAKSPEDKIADIRALYSARLNGFIIEEEPIAVPEVEAEEVGDAEVVDEALVVEPTPVRQLIRLDILIQHDSYELLPGVTVDISMANSAGEEKGHWRAWFDTSKVVKANVTQFTHILEDMAYEEGDGFFAEIRKPIPVEERSEYREFAKISGDS